MSRISRLRKLITGAAPVPGEEHPFLEGELTRLEHFIHFCALVWHSFVRNRCLVRASSLSFSTLIALIPMLAVAISVASSFLKTEGENQIYQAIDQFVATMVPPATVSAAASTATNAASAAADAISTNALAAGTNAAAVASTNSAPVTNTFAALGDSRMTSAQMEVARTIHGFVQNTWSGALGIFGMLLLLWVAIFMLGNVEGTFNDIWGITCGRNWLRRIGNHFLTLMLCPLALAGALSLVESSHGVAARQFIAQMPLIGELVFKIVPLLIICLVFSLLYFAVPNASVRPQAAVFGGVIAGSLWHLNNLLGYLYVSRVVSNFKIYGSLGLLPVFMAGLYFSWVILLLGVQISYVYQNRKSYLQDRFAENVNQRGREFIALRLMTCLGLRFQGGQTPATTQQIADELGISSRLVQQILQPLLAARLVNEIAGAEAAFQPGRSLDGINAHQVLLALRSVGRPGMVTREEPVRDEIYGEFARIEEAERTAASSVTMLALVTRARARLSPAAEAPATPVLALAEPAPVMTTHGPPVAEVPSEPADKLESARVPDEPLPEGRKIAVPEDNHDFPL